MNDKLYLELTTLLGEYREKARNAQSEIQDIVKKIEDACTYSYDWDILRATKKLIIQQKIDYEKFVMDLENAIVRGVK